LKIDLGDYILNAYTIAFTTLLGAIGFLIRKIFTNEKQIGILETKLTTMTKNLENDILELKSDVKELLRDNK
jgi:hypothetical protein